MLSHSFEDLAQTFRTLTEAHFNYNRLVSVDRGEAIGHIETAVNAMLNAFHNLYDLMGQNNLNSIDWYDTPELCVILAIRNARHHNKANRIRNLYNFHRYEMDEPAKIRNYMYVSFPAGINEEGGSFFDIPLSWSDLCELINMPRHESRLRATAKAYIREYLNADAFETEAKTAGISIERIFFNFVPLAMNAGKSLYPHIKDHISTDSVEASYFLSHFEKVGAARTREPSSDIIEFRLPK